MFISFFYLTQRRIRAGRWDLLCCFGARRAPAPSTPTPPSSPFSPQGSMTKPSQALSSNASLDMAVSLGSLGSLGGSLGGSLASAGAFLSKEEASKAAAMAAAVPPALQLVVSVGAVHGDSSSEDGSEPLAVRKSSSWSRVVMQVSGWESARRGGGGSCQGSGIMVVRPSGCPWYA